VEPATDARERLARRCAVPRYATQFSYTPQAWAALIKNPQDRRQAFGALASKLGGNLVDAYITFGEYDGLVIFDAPDDTTAAAMAMAIIAPGHIKTLKTMRALPIDEAMEAMRKAGSVSYQGPG
jgi:uncharacterized protein with GYD domain